MVKATLRTAKPPVKVEVAPAGAPPSPAPAAPPVAATVVEETSPEQLVSEPDDNPQPGVPAVREQYTSRVNLTGEGIEGDWGDDDVKLPQFKIVQGSGVLSQRFQNGEIIFAEESLLPPPSIKPDAKNPSIRIVPISLRRQWVEKLSQERADAGEMPRIAYSLQEVYDLGGTTRWSAGGQQPDNFWQDAARCMILIEKPESSLHSGFALEFNGKCYAVAVWYVSGGAYRASAKVIVGASQSSLLVPVTDEKGQPKKSDSGQIIKRPMLWKHFWSVNFVRKPVGPKQYMVWYPIVRLAEATTPEIRDYCAGLASNAAAQAAAAVEE